MTTPAPHRGGFVFLDPEQGRVLRVVPFQYNPDRLTRTLRPQGIGDDPGDRLETLRLYGPPQETFHVEAEFNAADQWASAAGPEPPADIGLFGALSALESAVCPTSVQLASQQRLASRGVLEVAPVEAPVPVLVLGPRRVLPVRIAEVTVTEEAHDGQLNPVRARVSLTMRVLTVDDVGPAHPAGGLYLRYQQGRERFAALVGYGPGAVGYQGP
ncbi:hypothetical protein ACFVFQ_29765 [Streptomyces sp. NPDC057743]|uniref:hypothetical protein n=1 Tax=Streptomyces sp. NPDC057743 TaxID=3346236 RepID=UPI0036B7D5D3